MIYAAIIAWLAIGALGSELFRRRVNAKYPMLPADTWLSRPCYALTALTGPISLVAALVSIAWWSARK